MKRITIIGAGISSLAAACELTKKGYKVEVYEKLAQPGGRIRMFEKKGFKFDMGPSWYWMPEIYDNFFKKFNKKVSDYYSLKKLSPSYQVVFKNNEKINISDDFETIKQTFEQEEQGSGEVLQEFIDDAEIKYDVGMNGFVQKPSLSIKEFLSWEILVKGLKLSLFKPISKVVRAKFKSEKIRQILEFPVLFLGAKPSKIPALYSLMNYADLKLGTWYPMGGMENISQSFYDLAVELGVKFYFNAATTSIESQKGKVKSITINHLKKIDVDVLISGADYAFTEQLLKPSDRNYSDDYWTKKTFAPSSILFYLGVNKKVKNLHHHNLFFDESFDQHASEIYDHPRWPSKPLFYVCAPSKTDQTVAPENCENLFVLIPLAPGLKDTPEEQEAIFNKVLDRLEKHTNTDIRNNLLVKETFSVKDFESTYNSYKGNAYGLANTLAQTAILKPKLINKKLSNMYYTGQLTTPGPGVPPSIISGEVVANLIHSNQ